MTKILLFSILTLLFSCKNASKQTKNDTEKRLVVVLDSKSGSNAKGTAVFIEKNGEISLEVKVEGLSEGLHAIHLHEKADCSSPDGLSTGGHWNPTHSKHGKWGDPEGFHRGDIGNLVADKNGKASLLFKTDLWCLTCDDPIKNIVGKAVIIHQGTDDFTTQPTGNAGGRISCGGILLQEYLQSSK